MLIMLLRILISIVIRVAHLIRIILLRLLIISVIRIRLLIAILIILRILIILLLSIIITLIILLINIILSILIITLLTIIIILIIISLLLLCFLLRFLQPMSCQGLRPRCKAGFPRGARTTGRTASSRRLNFARSLSTVASRHSMPRARVLR